MPEKKKAHIAVRPKWQLSCLSSSSSIFGFELQAEHQDGLMLAKQIAFVQPFFRKP
jgi:hypothetical protein